MGENMALKNHTYVRIEFGPELYERLAEAKAKAGEKVRTQDFVRFIVEDWLQAQETEA
jgi:hypothetical protein